MAMDGESANELLELGAPMSHDMEHPCPKPKSDKCAKRIYIFVFCIFFCIFRRFYTF